ncbi:MAG: hypothetical protein JO082_05470 [Mycobacterium sp.]|nr:hypothetical protein [Mycobacterium sp.]
MTLGYVADTAATAGTIFGMGLWWAAGLALLIAGLRRRSASGKQSEALPPGYAAQNPDPAYPGQPGSPGLPPDSAYSPPPPPRRSRGTVMIVLGVVFLVLGVFAVLGAVTNRGGSFSSTSGPVVGNCYYNSGPKTDAVYFKPLDCANPDAIYQYVAAAGADGTCPDSKGGNETEYTLVTEASGKYCYEANLIEGDCYQPVTASTLAHVGCNSAASGVVKVVKRVDGEANATCPPGVGALSFPQTPRTYCLVAAGNQ